MLVLDKIHTKTIPAFTLPQVASATRGQAFVFAGYFFMDNSIEIWKDVVGWEGIYQVSNIGRFMSLLTGNILSDKKGKMKHGTRSMYSKYKCRCASCSYASSEYYKKYNLNKNSKNIAQ